MRRAKLGRIIGATGGVCASLLWGVLLFGCLAWLLDPPRGLAGIAIIGIIPLAVMAAPLFVFSVSDVVVLVRRVDTRMPWRIGSVHLVLAAVSAFGHDWTPALGLFAIGATQLVAIAMFQTPVGSPPPHALSQR